MADRYWVGGTSTWNTTSTTNWSASSGGGSGASVPTVADNVFFDQAGAYTVTMTGALACLDITVSAGTVTFATGTSPTLDVRGSMTLAAATVWSSTGNITFTSTSTGRTVTTNGVAITGAVNFNGVGGGWTLGSAFTTNSGFTFTAGTIDTANYNVSSGGFVALTASSKTLTLGSTTYTSSGNFNTTGATITVNAGTSTIVMTGTTNTLGGGQTFYNVSYTSPNAGTRTITGTNTFNNFAVTGPTSAGVVTVTFNAQQTINGTLSTTGTAGNRRVFFASATYGISQDLVVNSAPSLTDADFRGLYVRGTSAPISGTRIGNSGECRGITFDAPKTVYWNLAGAQNWSANGWTDTSTGTPNTNFFPLPQDTATFTNAGSVTGTITLDTAIAYCPNVDMSGRTSAMTLGTSNATTVYGNWTNGSGTAFTGTAALTFSGGTTQTITSAGKTFTCPITVDTYGGTVQLADALTLSAASSLTVTNGTFDTVGYAVTCNTFSSNNSNVRTIYLRSSTISMGGSLEFGSAINLALEAGTSTIAITGSGDVQFNGGGRQFHNLSFTNTANDLNPVISGTNIFNNINVAARSTAGINTLSFSANQTINGTLTCAGASAVRRIFLRSNTIGTPRTLTVNAISATDCDFRDINLAGAASGASPTRAGNCGGNSGITFPAAKTVYWNLAGAQNWSATAWAPGSGGTPDINNFPLAQDTAVFDNTGSVTGTITINTAWNIGTFDASLRTSAMTLTTSTNSPVVYGDWKFGTGVTSSSTTGTITFSSPTTETITSNGVQFGCPVTVNHPSGTVQLADALSLGSTRTLSLLGGIFDAVTYNVTTGLFLCSGSTNTLRMGSGTWTISGTGPCWSITSIGAAIAGTSTIVLSDTSTSARTFNGASLYYNKLTIGGTTGTSTLTITGANTFGELASTKTVAHTITFPSSVTNTIGKWAVTGTVGNVVTVNSSTAATAFTLSIAGPANSGIDYLSIRDCTVATTSPGEFYVGANSTNVSGNTRVIFTATPAARTLYWVGGTGNWSDTARWSTTDGSGSGAAIPTSLDAVNFTNLSNATAYTATIDSGVTLARCASFTMAGPGTGNVTFAGTVGIAFHGNVSFAATGITRTYTGGMQWAGNSSYTFTTNGLSLASSFIDIGGIGATWTLGSALTTTSSVNILRGTFSTSASNYAITASIFSSNNSNIRSITLNGSTVTLSGVTLSSFSASNVTNLTFNAGTSQINLTGLEAGIVCGGLTFNNVSFTSTAAGGTRAITGVNTFNTLSFSGTSQPGIITATLSADQTITTLTLNAGTAAAFRTFLASNTIGTQRTLNVTTLTAGAADYDFRDIAIAGGAAPIAPTRAGDCKGNSGITFPGAKTVYYRNTGSANWGTTGTGSWSPTSGAAADATQFPLAQDTAVFPAATHPASGSTTTVNANYNIGAIDMSLRTTNTMTLAIGTTTPQIYGNWINGTGTTLTGTGTLTFAGRGSQTITSAGAAWTQQIVINTSGGSVTLQDAFTSTSNSTFTHTAGTFDAANYNITLAAGFNTSNSNTRTVTMGSGTWTFSGTAGWTATTSTNLTLTGTGTISLTSANAKPFSGGGVNYSGITLDQGGAGTLTISGNNTFKDITNSYSATGATTIALGNTTQTLTNPWTATGAATRVLTVSGTSAASPGTLIFSGSGTAANVDYLNISNVRAYDLLNEWYAGPNSTNSGSLGWYFVAAGGTVYAVTITETGTGTDAITARVTLVGTISETGTGTDTVSGSLQYLGTIDESGTGTDSISARYIARPNITETATGSDVESAILAAIALINETATGTDTVSALAALNAAIAEASTISDLVIATKTYLAAIIEAATAADADSARATFQAQLAETATAQDIIQGFMVAAAAIAESATGTDQINAFTALAAAVIETATGTDAISAKAILRGILLEIATITDSVNASGSTYNAPVVELAVLQDLVRAAATFPTSITETATGTQTNSAAFIPYANITESATVTDAASALANFAARMAETATISDQAIVAPSVFNAITVATATALDNFNPAGSIYNAPVIETAVVLDSLIGGFLWNLINTGQNPDWANIIDSQTPNWQTISSAQTPGWATISNPQSPGWTGIDDNQSPNWQNISNS
jgi:fibronectin-binding autotransporter adhesin